MHKEWIYMEISGKSKTESFLVPSLPPFLPFHESFTTFSESLESFHCHYSPALPPSPLRISLRSTLSERVKRVVYASLCLRVCVCLCVCALDVYRSRFWVKAHTLSHSPRTWVSARTRTRTRHWENPSVRSQIQMGESGEETESVTGFWDVGIMESKFFLSLVLSPAPCKMRT